MVEDVVAVELIARSGVKHHVITFGRIQDPVDPEALVEIVIGRASMFGLGDAVSARVCGSLQEAKEAPYFFEALIDFGARLARAALEVDWELWRATTDREMRDGRHLYYLGDPDAAWIRGS